MCAGVYHLGPLNEMKKRKLSVAFTLHWYGITNTFCCPGSQNIIGLIHRLAVDFNRVVARSMTMEREKKIVSFFSSMILDFGDKLSGSCAHHGQLVLDR